MLVYRGNMKKILHDTKSRIILVLFLSLLISLFFNFHWVSYERKLAEGNIDELSRGFEYEQRESRAMYTMAQTYYDTWQMCNKALFSDDASEKSVNNFQMDYISQMADVKTSEAEYIKYRDELSEYKKNLKYTVVVNTD